MKLQKIENNSLLALLDESIDNILKVIILNEGEDLFIMSNIDENGPKTFLCYIKEFRNKEKKNVNQIKKIEFLIIK